MKSKLSALSAAAAALTIGLIAAACGSASGSPYSSAALQDFGGGWDPLSPAGRKIETSG